MMVLQVHFFYRSKYPLSIVEVLLHTFGKNIGCSYDIGCKFGTTVNKTSLGVKACTLNFQSIVGSFHGYAHKCCCQLKFLPMYVEGMGVKDLKGCERFFSRSNALALSVYYASFFHWKQNIIYFIEHMDLL